VTCGTWIGFDNRQTLGDKETGAKAALPMWMDFMKTAIANKPDEKFPEGNAPEKQLDVPLTPPGESPAVETIPKTEEETEPDAAEPEGPGARGAEDGAGYAGGRAATVGPLSLGMILGGSGLFGSG
jgi:penicillin-binding protein 1A